MNILMVLSTPLPPSEGIGNHVAGLAKRLADRGHGLVLMTRGGWRKTEEQEAAGLRVLKIPFLPLYPFHVHLHGYFLRRAVRSLRPRPDLVHLHSPLVPAVPPGYAVVTTFHSASLNDFSRLRGHNIRTLLLKFMARHVSYRIEKKLLRFSDEIIVVHDNVGEAFEALYSRSRRYHVLPNVVDVDFYKPAPASPQSVNPSLLFVGRLGDGKGLFELVDSARRVVLLFPRLKYVLVGAGPLEKAVLRRVRNLGLDAHFEFRGVVTDPQIIRQHYQDSLAVLIPSYFEGCPLVLLEALACAKPVIAAEAGFEKGLLRNGENALLIKPKSAEELAAATIKLLSSPALCARLGEEARKTALEMMDLRSHTDRLEDIYSQALAARSSGLGRKKSRTGRAS